MILKNLLILNIMFANTIFYDFFMNRFFHNRLIVILFIGYLVKTKLSDQNIRKNKNRTGEGRYKVQPIFERCTLFFRKFIVVPYNLPLYPFSEKFSGPCTL